jgi:hypothetical protein
MASCCEVAGLYKRRITCRLALRLEASKESPYSVTLAKEMDIFA